ncbi:MAG: class I SAM-dependent methyltransferase [Planctomycetaceae bacterium]|nr:class I SAM-dependent methyltransferase [Planctomycetaceae bacterium]
MSSIFADLGAAPPSNSFLTTEQLNAAEVYYPLKVWVCRHCFLVQIDEFKKSTEIFSEDYVYFSSVSTSWLEHSKNYVEMITKRLLLNERSLIIEIASNDGYLLQYVREKKIPCLGIEPTASTAAVAKLRGIPTREEFFGVSLAEQLVAEGKQADLLLGNNVLAHVPDINDFVAGLRIALKPTGTVTMEFPHLLRLIKENQFDTIYHEHFSYLSLSVVQAIFRKHQLDIYDVEELVTHGGSLRIYAKHVENERIAVSENVNRLLDQENREGIRTLSHYDGFGLKMEKIRDDFLRFLLQCKAEGKAVVAYGAAAKGNTLLNYCGVKAGMIEFVCDRAESKQGKFLPGSRTSVVPENVLKERKPDFIVIFPWNIRDEVEKQLEYVRHWGGQFVTAIPELTVF